MDGDTPDEVEDADFLIVLIDHNSNWQRLYWAQLDFADYAGLQAEYEGDTGATVLETSAETWMASNVPADPLPSNYRTQMGEEINEA